MQFSASVLVVMMRLSNSDWHDASMSDLAILMLELDSGVADAKLPFEAFFDVAQD